MKNLKKFDYVFEYVWAQEESNEMDADVGDMCMVPSVQIGLRYWFKDLSEEGKKEKQRL